MNEASPGQPFESRETPASIDLEKLTFEELGKLAQKANELAKSSFTGTENGFKNIEGGGIFIRQQGSKYVLSEITLPEMHQFIATHTDSILVKGSEDKEEMMGALKQMVEELGYRIIE